MVTQRLAAKVDRQKDPSPPLEIVYRAIDEIKANPKNPRLHSPKQIRQIARSIETFGYNVPIAVDHEGQIIAGHGRLLASKLLGIKQVPTICLDHLSEAQIRAFMIADNRLTERSTWDENLLSEQLKILSDLDLNFSLEVTGFEMGEIDLMMEGLAPISAADEAAADELPCHDSQVCTTQPGDVWLLGPHRVLCGDSLDERNYAVLMGEERAAAIFTDPPYNVPIEGFVTHSSKVKHSEFAMASGEMTSGEFKRFLRQSFQLMADCCHPGALVFICMDWRHCSELLAAADGVFAQFENLCIWVKGVGGLGSFYRSEHELIFLFKAGEDLHRNNIQLGRFGRNRTNVWQYPRPNSFGKPASDDELTMLHPTVKPVSLVADAIVDCTERGRDIVVDPFLGSGTTLIAAERVGRICYGIELSLVYVDLAIRRWERFTSLAAVHASSGQTFAKRQEAAGGQ